VERRTFIKRCCLAGISLPSASLALQSCASIYYANATKNENMLTIQKSEFKRVVRDKERIRQFVLLNPNVLGFPICLYRHTDEVYSASLMQCTHQGCELSVGGGIYSCPCHGSEFSVDGKVLEGPADKDLRQFKTTIDNTNIYVHLV